MKIKRKQENRKEDTWFVVKNPNWVGEKMEKWYLKS